MSRFNYPLLILSLLFASLLFAAPANGQWVQTNGPAPIVQSKREIAAATAIDSTILIATVNDSVFRATDFGHVWQAAATPWKDRVRFFSRSKDVVIAVTESDLLYESNDTGRTWKAISPNLAGGHIASILVSDSNVYVGLTGGVVMASSDLGTSWVNESSGLPNTTVTGLALLGPRLIALTELGGIYSSTNSGQSWIPSQNGFTGVGGNTAWVNASAIYVASQEGIFRSYNGADWQVASTGLPSSAVISITSDAALLLAGTAGDGLYVSTNNGTTWQSQNAGLPDLRVKLVFESAGTVFVLLQSGGLYRFDSRTFQSTAVSTGLSFMRYAMVRSLMADPARGLFAGTWGKGIYKTTDQGATWISSNSGLDTARIDALAELNDVLFAGRNESWATPDSGLYRSTDGGLSWTVSNNGLLNPGFTGITQFKISGTQLFATAAATDDRGGLYVSDDLGSTWSQMLAQEYASAVEVASDTIATADTWQTQAVMWISTDRGRNWKQANTGLPSNTTVKCFVKYREVLYAGTSWRGLYSTTNGGASWLPVPINALSHVETFLPLGDRLTLGTSQGVLLYDGKSWFSVNQGLTDTVYALAADQTYLYAGTSKGVWRRPIAELTNLSVSQGVQQTTVPIFPNPTVGRTEINFTGSNHAVLAHIYNALGEEVERITADAGTRRLELNLGRLPAGAYAVVVQIDGQRVAQRVVKLDR